MISDGHSGGQWAASDRQIFKWHGNDGMSFRQFFLKAVRIRVVICSPRTDLVSYRVVSYGSIYKEI